MMNNGAKVWQRGFDYDGLLDEQQIEEGQASLDAYEASILPHEGDEPLTKCPLCEKTIWPDDPTSMYQMSSDEQESEVHRLCALTARVATLEKKLSELSYRVAA